MCIDGTAKFSEEIDDNFQYSTNNNPRLTDSVGQEFSGETLTKNFAEIKGVNSSLLQKDIPCLVISVKKNRKGHIKELHEQVCALKESEGVKIILYVEHTVNANDLPTALWRFCNNLDPKRDHHLYKHPITQLPNQPINQYLACMGFDGTRKTKEFDDFQRDWPNIIVADDETIKAVDEKWNELGIGKFISSPSLKFKGQMYGEEAVVE